MGVDFQPLSPKALRCPARAHQSHLHVAGTPVSAALSPQDMADYVAYVAKDPINQRGEASGGGDGREGLACVSCLMKGKKHNGAQLRPSSVAVSKTLSDPQLGPLYPSRGEAQHRGALPLGMGKGGGRGSNQIPKARPNSRLHTRAIPKTKYFIKTGKSFDF